MNEIKINIACDEVIEHDDYGNIKLCKPNLSQDIVYNLNGNDLNEIYGKYNPISVFFNNCNNYFTLKTLDELTDANETFVYPIFLYDLELFEKDVVDLPEKLVNSVLNNNSKILFIEHVEGTFFLDFQYTWVSNLVKKYNFNRESVIVISSNVKVKMRHDYLADNWGLTDNFISYPYSYFSIDLWFTNPAGNLNCENFRETLINQLPKQLSDRKSTNKEYHFLCFNRIPRNHRICIFGELMTNPNLIGKSITTLGALKLRDPNRENFCYGIEEKLGDDYIYSKQRLLDFFTTYNSSVDYKFDNDLSINQANVFNSEAHNKTFINLVTETTCEPNYVFYSEKTYKPIYACQPFIFIAGPFHLKKLKEVGYKTFDRWWDESYDNKPDFTKRLGKIVSILEEISKWDMDKCNIVLDEMEEILIHNYKTMVNNRENINLYKFLIGI
jgi:hypothetical protein